MSDADNRQKAEDIYFQTLDLMAEGKLEEAVAAYQRSIAADPGFTEAMDGPSASTAGFTTLRRHCSSTENCGVGSR
jgi:hypothetical protein